MRLCLVSSSFYPASFYGGPISSNWDMSNFLSKENVDVYVSSTNANGKTKLDVTTNQFIKKKNNLFVKYYNEQIINYFSFSFIFGIWSDIRKSDIIYIQYLYHYTVFFSLIFSIIQSKKIVLCPRGSLSEYTLSYKNRLIKKLWITILIKPFNRLINWQATSYLEKEDILRKFSKAKVSIIPDGIDFSSFQLKSNINIRELIFKYTGKKYDNVSQLFFSMGRLHSIKSFDILIKSFSMYVKNENNSKMIIAGPDDGQEKKLQYLIKKLNLYDSVFLIGQVNLNQKRELLINSTVFCLCSQYESFGIVIAESLACGTPVIVSNKTPWKDIENHNCGIFVNNNINDFFNALKDFKIESFSEENCKNYARLNFDWKIIIKQFIELIEMR
tara:strand:+ start:67618 stop:68775 length:1158 start_codon:yes stop_codon:yes gene_type:complete